MRHGTSASFWANYHRKQDFLARSCFNEKAAEAARRKLFVTSSATVR